jgi:hypothetical protein
MLDPKEEQKFKELKDKCRELKVPAPPEIMIGLQVHEGGVLTFDDVQRGHSWNRNFYNSLFGLACTGGGDESGLFGAGYMSGKVVSGTIYSEDNMISYYTQYGNAGYPISMNGFSETTTTGQFGIRVGTGDTAFSPDQVALVTPIIAGSGSGQFGHVAMTTASKAYTAGTHVWKGSLLRIFNNNSGASITVKECGLYWSGGVYVNAGNNIFMFERSVLSPTVAVANGAQLTVTYEISMDFSAID